MVGPRSKPDGTVGNVGKRSGVGRVLLSISEVTCLRYSRSGKVLAVGCRDKLIHILSVGTGYKRVSVCKGHSSFPQQLDFSQDELYIQSNDAAREILYWNVQTAKREKNILLRDQVFSSGTCVYGWHCHGVHNGKFGRIEEGDINAVMRSVDGQLVVAGGSNTVEGPVKLFRYPCLDAAIPHSYVGHTCPVLDVAFLSSDEMVVTIGGNDMSVLLWDVK